MFGLRGVLNISAWHVYIKESMHALKSVYRRLLAINVQAVLNMPRSKCRVPYKELLSWGTRFNPSEFLCINAEYKYVKSWGV